MKKYREFALGVILSLGLSVHGFGQQPAITANIPFAFHVGNTPIPAGQYTIESPHPGIQVLRSRIGKTFLASVPTIVAKAHDPMAKGTLVFNCYGDEHFLSQIFWAGAADGRELVKSRLEAGLARVTPGAGLTRIPGSQD